MEMRTFTLKLPEPMVAAALKLANQRDVTLGHIIRMAVSAEIKKNSRNAKTPNRADELLLAPLRVLLASDFAMAQDWTDLNQRLNDHGYALREAGGGLALHSYPDGVRMCKASELGHSYSSLMRRYNAPFPGHAHRHLVDKLLGPTQAAPGEGSDFDVIEPF